jgi:hypothetical protein
MGRFESRITILRPLQVVFDTYTQPDTFRWADVRSVTWVHGKPWELESRMHIKTNDAFGVTMDQVVTHFEPYRRIDFISHFAGITLLTQVHFRALSDDQTEIHGKLEFIGTFSRMAGFAIGPALEQGTEKFYRDLKRACEGQESSTSASAHFDRTQ